MIGTENYHTIENVCILSKYEEFRPPEVGDICYIMDNAYTRDEILDMEVKILNTLKFEVTVPSALQFLEFYLKHLKIEREGEDKIFFMCQYLVEATLLETKFLKYAAIGVTSIPLHPGWAYKHYSSLFSYVRLFVK